MGSSRSTSRVKWLNGENNVSRTTLVLVLRVNLMRLVAREYFINPKRSPTQTNRPSNVKQLTKFVVTESIIRCTDVRIQFLQQTSAAFMARTVDSNGLIAPEGNWSWIKQLGAISSALKESAQGTSENCSSPKPPNNLPLNSPSNRSYKSLLSDTTPFFSA